MAQVVSYPTEEIPHTIPRLSNLKKPPAKTWFDVCNFEQIFPCGYFYS
jgi:hypothetical protein